MNEPSKRPVCGRFAPSPSGRMHLGNVWAGLLAWLSARSAGGRMVLRLEDLDPDRCRPEFCRQVMEDLEWLGLDWDNEPVYQSQRTEIYAECFERLEELGLLYPCYCTRAERLAASAPHRSDGAAVYDGRCRSLSAPQREELASSRRPAWRVAVPEEEIAFDDLCQGRFTQRLEVDCGDFILRRSDGVYAYQLAVVADDALMGVNQVVRGEDLLDSTPRQIWLNRVLGWQEPEYAHVPLLVAGDGRRLAKRDRDLDLGVLRQSCKPEKLLGVLAYSAGLLDKPQAISARELATVFTWENLRREDILLDAEELL